MVQASKCAALLASLFAGLGLVSAAARATEVPDESTTNSQIEASLSLLQTTAATYIDKRDCFSCHHQALPAMAAELARDRGLEFDAEALAAQAKFTSDYFGGRRERIVAGSGVPGGPYTAGYALVALAAAERKADETTAALVTYLEKTQRDDGSWRIRTHRPPLEDSHFTATALAVRGLALYPPQADDESAADRIERGRDWLLENQPKTNEDFAFHVLGLRWSGAGEEPIEQARRDLFARQRDDGGWSQLDDMESDAYATGQALAALYWTQPVKNDKANRQQLKRGLAFLLDSRLDDASWQVETRSRPIQRYFESGFPHGKSQFISTSATAWATMALMLARDERQ